MVSPQRIQAILDGSARDPGARLLRAATAAVEPGYRAVVARRNRRYDRGLGVDRLERPVVSIGNLTTGGTGKTPVVAWLASALYKAGLRPGILLRGYGKGEGESDEAKLLAEATLPLDPGAEAPVPVVADPDRVAAGRRLLQERPELTALLLDDGFQHRRLHRDFDLVLIDATNPFGGGRLLPRGLLREPVEALRRADAILVTRCDQASDADGLVRDLQRFDKPIYRSSHRPTQLRRGRAIESVELLRGQQVAAFCGIGNPDSFQRTLTDLGAEVIGFEAFADHHPFQLDELLSLQKRAEKRGASRLITTAKDAVRLPAGLEEKPPVWVIDLAVEFALGDEARLCGQILQKLGAGAAASA